ncbi:hypothetical protein RhiLY_11945 [Ceratobasidium sp. AG-Ba]|nr:hypothetical protein RhiLY_11945 [Ceratobasidium sp. AG-Ba]
MLDAIGGGPPSEILRLWHPQTIANGAKEWTRPNVHTALADPIERELKTKPGCHFTTGARAYPILELIRNNAYFSQ